ncbi:alpha/beta hydrolase [Paenibacillus cisolokensis]|uniref:alpha/beta fold hydrolase n=1 Tax=Paenibacillus cisolokensis TaxID=1658519 RepID=UPI003D2A594C
MAFSPAAEQISKRYKEINHPVVIVAGDNDPFGTKEQSLRLKEDIPHAELILLPEVAHMIPQNHPQQVVNAIDRLWEIIVGDMSDSSMRSPVPHPTNLTITK